MRYDFSRGRLFVVRLVVLVAGETFRVVGSAPLYFVPTPHMTHL